MHALKGLKLNCFLAPLLPSIIAAILVFYYTQSVNNSLDKTIEDALSQHLSSIAHAIHPENEQPLNAYMTDNTHWASLAVVELQTDHRLAVVKHVGTEHHLDEDNPEPLLISSFLNSSNAWKVSHNMFAAATPLPHTNTNQILYGEYFYFTESTAPPFLFAGGILFIGMLLALYLSRRIYRPICTVAQEAENTLMGSPSSDNMILSDETQGAMSSVITLVKEYRDISSSDEPTEHSRKPPCLHDKE